MAAPAQYALTRRAPSGPEGAERGPGEVEMSSPRSPARFGPSGHPLGGCRNNAEGKTASLARDVVSVRGWFTTSQS